MKIILFLATILGLSWIQLALADCKPASRNCNSDNCMLPNCSCSDDGPEEIPLEERPQLVFLTFDDAFTALAEEKYYRRLFDGTYTNPNGCAITATHFLSARSMDYSLVHKYWTMGHKMESHSITHRSPPSYWAGLNISQWRDEVVGMKQMISMYAKIPPDDIKGVRAPFLQGGGDAQFAMMQEEGFEYDCSMPDQGHGYLHMDNGRWPYTLDYRTYQNCQIKPCPLCSHPGMWVQPILDLEDNRERVDGKGYPCAMLDSCLIPEETAEATNAMLLKNFYRAYNGSTRAPFGLYVHAAWFFGYDWRYEGYKMFIKEITKLPNVWIVPVRNGIEYKKAPVTNAALLEGALEEFFGCSNFPRNNCLIAEDCKYEHVENEDIHDVEEHLKICDFCPDNYPWLGNPEGN